MKRKTLAVTALLFAVLASSCTVFYAGVPPIAFVVDDGRPDMKLTVLDISKGSHEKNQDGRIIAHVPEGRTELTFAVSSSGQTGTFSARTYGSRNLKGSFVEVGETYGFRGGMWIACRRGITPGTGVTTFQVQGCFGSPSSFIIGRVGRDPRTYLQASKLDIVAAHEKVPFAWESGRAVLSGKGGTSVRIEGFDRPINELMMYGPQGSSVVIEQALDRKQWSFGADLPLEVVLLPGRARILWFPAGSKESYADVSLEPVPDSVGDVGILAFSSMLDK